MFIFALKVCVFLYVNTWQSKLLEQAHSGLLLYQPVLASFQSLHRVHRIIKVGKDPKDHEVQPSTHLQCAYSTKQCRTGVASSWNLCHRSSLSSQPLVSVSSVGVVLQILACSVANMKQTDILGSTADIKPSPASPTCTQLSA